MPVCVCIVTEESVCGQLYTMYCTNTSLYNTILCVSKVVAAAVTPALCIQESRTICAISRDKIASEATSWPLYDPVKDAKRAREEEGFGRHDLFVDVTLLLSALWVVSVLRPHRYDIYRTLL